MNAKDRRGNMIVSNFWFFGLLLMSGVFALFVIWLENRLTFGGIVIGVLLGSLFGSVSGFYLGSLISGYWLSYGHCTRLAKEGGYYGRLMAVTIAAAMFGGLPLGWLISPSLYPFLDYHTTPFIAVAEVATGYAALCLYTYRKMAEKENLYWPPFWRAGWRLRSPALDDWN